MTSTSFRRSIAALLAAGLAAPAALADEPRLPAAAVGLWGHEAADCTASSPEFRVAIKLDSIDFYASSCRLGRIATTRRPGAYRLALRCRAEGEVSDLAAALRVLSSQRIEIDLDLARFELVRCEGRPGVAE